MDAVHEVSELSITPVTVIESSPTGSFTTTPLQSVVKLATGAMVIPVGRLIDAVPPAIKLPVFENV